MAKLVTAQPRFKMLVANIEGAGDPSRGRNPVKVRTGFIQQHIPEVARGGAPTKVLSPDAPGITTYQGLLSYTTPPVPVGASATVEIVDTDFSDNATLYLGDYTLVSNEDFTAGAAVQATATLTVNATPSTATITIGGQALTATAGARTPGNNDYDGTLGTPALIAAEIIAAINDAANAFALIATAASGGGALVNLTAVPVGAAGNAVTLTSSTADVSASGATFSGGADADAAAATDLAAAIDALPGFSAVAVGTTVTITGPVGLTGNTLRFEAVYEGVVENFTLSPDSGFLADAEPFIGPPEIL